jgi:hypothetical protein
VANPTWLGRLLGALGMFIPYSDEMGTEDQRKPPSEPQPEYDPYSFAIAPIDVTWTNVYGKKK